MLFLTLYDPYGPYGSSSQIKYIQTMIRIVEVGPRDGLQNEATPIPTDVKLAFIQNLIDAGLTEIEATSFVSPKWVPQLADAAELWPQLPSGARFSALVPNVRGLERAMEVGCDRIALFTAASDAFTQKNINMSVEQSLQVFEEVIATFRAVHPKGWVRGYVSTAFECPIAGRIDPATTVAVANALHDLGVDEISLGDTLGVAVPAEVNRLCQELRDGFSGDLGKIAWHFHDTRGTAIANVATTLEWNVYSTFDASAAGLGGCPYAKGAGGNLSTEDLVYFMERSGVQTGVDWAKLSRASLPILQLLGRGPQAKSQLAALALAE
ncbi:MAG: hydroxymethylglutaryl-CoA lyase [Fimbriimonadaceae bacterium]|nr:hydroxymethylglutaryl-CoA lyase [Fimbriimonadaceae bacterium]